MKIILQAPHICLTFDWSGISIWSQSFRWVTLRRELLARRVRRRDPSLTLRMTRGEDQGDRKGDSGGQKGGFKMIWGLRIHPQITSTFAGTRYHQGMTTHQQYELLHKEENEQQWRLYPGTEALKIGYGVELHHQTSRHDLTLERNSATWLTQESERRLLLQPAACCS